MKFDTVWNNVGEFGRFQWYSLFLLVPISIIFASQNLAMVFLGVRPAILCEKHFNESETIVEIEQYKAKGSDMDKNVSNKHVTILIHHEKCILEKENKLFINNKKVLCDNWKFQQLYFESSIVNEWNLICDSSWLVPIAQASYMAGVALGSGMFGHFADRWGRREIVVWCTIMQIISGAAVCFSHSVWMFLLLRFCVALSVAGQKNGAYVLSMELVGPNKRAENAVVHEIAFTAGFPVLAAAAYVSQSWRLTQGLITLPCIVFLTYKWLLPESPRWLYAAGKTEKAAKSLSRIAKMNKRSFDMSSVNITAETSSRVSVTELVRSRSLRARSLILWYTWFIVCCVFYGLSFYAVSLAGNPYVNFILVGLAELPGFVLGLLMTKYLGRRPALSTSLLVSGVAVIVMPAMPADHIVSTLLVLVGKCGVAMAFSVIYLFTSELYPTQLRNMGVGAGNVFARIGGVAAPFILMLTFLGKNTPVLIFGGCSLLAGFLCTMLPETRNQPLADTIEQAEQQPVASIMTLCLRCKGYRATSTRSEKAVAKSADDMATTEL